MHEPPQPAAPEPWVVWNGTFGILATATLGRVEPGASGRTAWMDKPFRKLTRQVDTANL